QRWWPTRHLTQLSVTVRGLFTSGRSVGILAVLSISIHLLSVATAWCAAQAVAAPFGFIQALLLMPPVILIATIPISIAGWGVRESALMLAFAYAGLPQSDGLLVSVLIGATMFIVGLAGGGVWLMGGDRIKAATTDRFDGADQTR